MDIDYDEWWCGGDSCTCDYVEISGQRYCGTWNWTLLSCSVQVRFSSDGSYTLPGFRAEWTAIPDDGECLSDEYCNQGLWWERATNSLSYVHCYYEWWSWDYWQRVVVELLSCTNIGSLYIICQHNSSTPSNRPTTALAKPTSQSQPKLCEHGIRASL